MKNYLRRAPTLREIILSQVPLAIYANRFPKHAVTYNLQRNYIQGSLSKLSKWKFKNKV